MIAENIYKQVDAEGYEFMVMNEIINNWKNNRLILIANGCETTSHGKQLPKRTTVGWEWLVEWNNRSTDCMPLKDLKASTPVQLAEYTIANKIAKEPPSKWMINYTISKRN